MGAKIFRDGRSWASRSPFVESKSSFLAGSYLLDAWGTGKVTDGCEDFSGRTFLGISFSFRRVEVELPCRLISPRRMGDRQGYGWVRRFFGTDVPGHLVLLSSSRSRASLPAHIS